MPKIPIKLKAKPAKIVLKTKFKAKQIGQEIGAKLHPTVVINTAEKVVTPGFGVISTYTFNYTIKSTPQNQYNLAKQLTEADPIIQKYALEKLKTLKGLKYSVTAKVEFVKPLDVDASGNPKKTDPLQILNSKAQIITNASQTVYLASKLIASFQEQIDTFISNGSGWVLNKIVAVTFDLIKYKPIVGSGYIPTPIVLEKRKALTNIQNKDEKCFLWSIIACLHPVEANGHKVSKYGYWEDKMNTTGIKFPMQFGQIEQFEVQNEVAINVWVYDPHIDMFYGDYVSSEISILHKSSYTRKYKDICNLLLIHDGFGKSHYVKINNMSRLFSYTKNYNGARYPCMHCLHMWTSEEALERHLQLGKCRTDVQCIDVYPEAEKLILKFEKKHYLHQLKLPIAIYLDLECNLSQVSGVCPDTGTSFTQSYQEHVPCGYAFKVVSTLPTMEHMPIQLYRGTDCIDKLLWALKRMEIQALKVIKANASMIITADEERSFAEAEDCHICRHPLGDDRVRDHDHMTGLYRGSAHNECNIAYNYKNLRIPVIVHNLKGYDSHFILKGKMVFDKITPIALNTQKFLSIDMDRLKFIDSFSFLSASLDSLVKDLYAGKNENLQLFANTKELTDDLYKMKLLCRKGVYPYDYMDSVERFKERQLPAPSNFYNRLNDEEIGDEDYAHAQQIWRDFGCRNLGDYHDLYLKTDVMLLADVFENFRTISMKSYRLDPCYYVSLPSFAWNAMLLMTGIELELMQADQKDMYEMFEDGIRGGMSMICNRTAKANHKDLLGYNPKRPTSHLLYLDANNLYGWAMCKRLPWKNYQWNEELTQMPIKDAVARIMKINNATDEIGYTFKVDLQYPKELHEADNDYPVAVERMKVSKMISPYIQALGESINHKVGECEKLIANLYDKKEYVVSGDNLRFYLDHGLVLTKIHSVVQYEQKAWMMPYIKFNSEKRAEPNATEFEKNFYKLMNNAVFGKTMENVRNRIDYHLVTTAENLKHDRITKLTAKPSYKNFQRFSDDLVGIEMYKTSVTLNKPIAVGFSVLDFSKIHMLDFHYNTIRKKYGNRARLMFTDTDSLLYYIETETLTEDLMEILDQLDTASYPKDHPLYSIVNNKIIGKFKDETNGDMITDFVGLSAKMYAFKVNGEDKKKCKGTKTGVVKKSLHFEDYAECLDETQLMMETNTDYTAKTFPKVQMRSSMNVIRFRDHEGYSQKINKISLSSYCDKRYHLDTFTSLSYGHYLINST